MSRGTSAKFFVVITLFSFFTLMFAKAYHVYTLDDMRLVLSADITNYEPETLLYVQGLSNVDLKRAINEALGTIGESMLLKSWTYWIDTSTYSVPTIRIKYVYEETAQQKSIVDRFIETNLPKIIGNAESDIEKVMRINAWLKYYLEYDYNYIYRTTYEALKYKKAVCEGYAKLFYRLAQASGLKVKIVTGQAISEQHNLNSHAWNAVKIGKYWYYVDVTWNDGTHTNAYLLFGQDKASETHHSQTWLPGEVSKIGYAERLYEMMLKEPSNRNLWQIFGKLYGSIVLSDKDMRLYARYCMANKSPIIFVTPKDTFESILSSSLLGTIGSYRYYHEKLFETSDGKEFYQYVVYDSDLYPSN